MELKWLAWEVTQACNLTCVHCRSSSDKFSETGVWTLEKCYSFLDQIKEMADPTIVLSGGEPLVRGDIFDIASYGTKLGLRMALATNGLLVDDDVCKKMIDSGIKIVSISIDGPNDEVHDNFRGVEGSFQAVLRAVEFFKKHNIKFIVNSSFTKRNQDYIKDCYKLAKSIGAHAWYMFLIVPTGRGEDIMAELVSKEDYETILNWHYDMERSEEELLVRPTCAPHYYRIWKERSKEDGLDVKRRSLSFSTGGGKGCIAGQSICFVSSKGDIFPCSYFALPAGNVFEDTLKNIWDKSELFDDMRNFSSYGGKCGVCKHLNVCGGCRARAYSITGDYLAEEPFCDYVPENY